MKFVLSGGGTAGHINPALALAEVLQDRGYEVFYAGTPQGVESRLVPQAGLPFTAFEASGFNRSHPLSLVKALRLVHTSTNKAKQWFSDIKPDVVACFGGYVCIPVGRAAQAFGIPLVVHEQNSVMGLANKYLAQRATSVALTYDIAGTSGIEQSKTVLTGNPVRKQMFAATRSEGRAYCNVPEDARMLVVFGGSLGARHINTAICAAKEALLARKDLYIRHVTGPKEQKTVEDALQLDAQQALRWQVVGYEDNMGKVLVAADMVVARSGATSLAEISALCIPAILVPFPYATADHQTTNAREYVEQGAAFMVADSQVEEAEFLELLCRMADDESMRNDMRRAAATFKTADAAAKLADVVVGAAARADGRTI